MFDTFHGSFPYDVLGLFLVGASDDIGLSMKWCVFWPESYHRDEAIAGGTSQIAMLRSNALGR